MKSHEATNGDEPKVGSQHTKSHQPFSFHFFFLVLTMTATFFHQPLLCPGSVTDTKKLAEEFTEVEEKRHMEELLDLGDSRVEKKDYDYAMAAYEQVFLFDPTNRKVAVMVSTKKKK